MPIMYRNGTLVGVEPAIALIFTVEGAHATGIEVRAAVGATFARGTLESP